MKLITLKCPHCNAMLEVQDGIDTFYCMYCGNKVMLEGMSKAAYRAKTKVKEMESQERIIEKQNEQERFRLNMENEKEKRNDKFLVKFLIGDVLFILLLMGFGFGIPKLEHQKKIRELQKIESEISQAISSEEYDSALLWANQLYLDDDWSSDENKVWNTKRENYIAMILEKKRETESDVVEYIPVPDASDKLKGKKYSKVVEQFESAGFTNIIAKVASKKAGLFDWNETVEHITISGKSSFTKEETFDKDSAVVIYYYSK
ncbi:MAG: hypothetical protein E7496_11420 [Ruminococcus sp.]|nr:hypothetical protein [Ruminococcus sp.]